MKYFMIQYQCANSPAEEWHAEIVQFIEALGADPELGGRIAYRCMKVRGGSDYCHLAAAADDQAIATLQQRAYFREYTEKSRRVAGAELRVTPLELIAETP